MPVVNVSPRPACLHADDRLESIDFGQGLDAFSWSPRPEKILTPILRSSLMRIARDVAERLSPVLGTLVVSVLDNSRWGGTTAHLKCSPVVLFVVVVACSRAPYAESVVMLVRNWCS